MQDTAAFYRNRARSNLYRRRKYPVNSEDWRHCVKEARQFVGYVRALEAPIKSDLARIDRMKDEDIDYSDIPPLHDTFLSKPTVDWPPATTKRTGADLIAALQASPAREIDIEPERYRVLNPLPPSTLEWLKQQRLRVAEVFRRNTSTKRKGE